jgi:hypothetical protein
MIGDVPTMRDRNEAVVTRMKHQRWSLDQGQGIAHFGLSAGMNR